MKTLPFSDKKPSSQASQRKIKRPASRSLLVGYIRGLSEFRQDLDRSRAIFTQARVWSDQCKYVISNFEPVLTTASSLAESYRFRSGHIKAQGRDGYLIIVNACDFYEKLDQTISFIREFGEMSRQKIGKDSSRQQILKALHQLDASFSDLMNRLDSLSEEL
jgi:hypothetical protein